MDQPSEQIDDLFRHEADAGRRDPLHRTYRVQHTQHGDLRRDLGSLYEQAEFDDLGYLSDYFDELLGFLDCDCSTSKPLAGHCQFCKPPARLCDEHLQHCDKCGRGMCRSHATQIAVPRKTVGAYCPRHGRWQRLKRFAGVVVAAILEPIVTTDHGSRS